MAKALASKELHDLLDARKKSFWWKAGRYDVMLKLSSPNKFELTHSRFTFDLTSIDVDQLRQNVETLKTEMQNVIQSNLPDFQAQPANWN
ncbi:MAG: hypothetical protein JJE04_08485 [Acidobacteriia bacterium]|nr:hypothetical protein [Terriglobia bacterium]